MSEKKFNWIEKGWVVRAIFIYGGPNIEIKHNKKTDKIEIVLPKKRKKV